MTTDREQLKLAGKLAVIFGGVLPGVGLGTISVMLPGISDAFATGHNGLLVKMVSTALGIGMMIGAPLGGILADRLGRRPVLLAATIVFGVAGCSAMLDSALWQLVLARFVVGVASGIIPSCIIAVIGDHFSGNDRSRWLGYNGAVATLILVMLIPVAGWLADMGWRYGFAIYATALPILILIAIGIPKGSGDRLGAENSQGRARSFPWSSVLLAVIAGTLSSGTTLYWPFRLRDVGVTTGGGLALYGLANVVMICAAGFSYGWLRRRLTVRHVFIVTGFLSAAALVIVASLDQHSAIMLGLVAEGVSIGWLTPNLSTYAIEMSDPKERARTIGLMQGALFGGPFLTQFALEPMSRAGGPSWALYGIAGLGALLGLAMLFGRRRVARDQPFGARTD